MYTNIHRKQTNIQCTILPLAYTYGEIAWQFVSNGKTINTRKPHTEQKVMYCMHNTQSELNVQQ